MKNTKRIITAAMAVLMAAGTASAFVGCGEKVANDENTLEIYVANYGYGYDWVDEAIKLFKEQDWVKEKYPNLNIPTPKHNSERTFTTDRILAGPTANTFDLFFSCASSASAYLTNDTSGKSNFEDLTDVYESKVPGEDVLYKDKMIDEYYEESKTEKLDGSTGHYSVPWVHGYMGILYNKDLVEANLGADYIIPRTTDEMSQMAEDIKEVEGSKKDKRYPFITATNVNYWALNFRTWWAQYEGIEGEERYWRGVDILGNRTWENIKQTGRLRALEVMEQWIARETNNSHRLVNTMEFTQAQAKFLLGEAYVMPNGDWFENEMRATAAENPYNYDIRFMKTPVVSALSEKLSYYTHGKTAYNSLDADTRAAYDEKLAFVIQAVDDGKDEATTIAEFATAELGALSASDYKKIKEARSVQLNVGGHEANIPAYATAKEPAKDFLRFLATDIACESFSKVTGGVSVPFEYDLEQKSPETFNNLSMLHQTRMKITKDGVNLKGTNTFRLSYLGGLAMVHATMYGIESYFTAQNNDDRKTAQDIYEDDIEYFTKDNGANWKSILVKSGYQA